jgi:hypothetical protein
MPLAAFGGGPFAAQSPKTDDTATKAAKGDLAQMYMKRRGAPSTLQNIVGYIGDYLAQLGGAQGVYAPQMAYQQERQDRLGDFEMQRQAALEDLRKEMEIKREFSSPDLPGLADEYNWFRSQPPEVQQGVQQYMKLRYPGQFVPPTPVIMEPGDTYEGGGGEMTATNPQTGEKIRFNAQTGAWEPMGGASPSNGSAPF